MNFYPSKRPIDDPGYLGKSNSMEVINQNFKNIGITDYNRRTHV